VRIGLVILPSRSQRRSVDGETPSSSAASDIDKNVFVMTLTIYAQRWIGMHKCVLNIHMSQKKITRKERWSLACHEAAHAVLGTRYGETYEYITIGADGNGNCHGVCMSDKMAEGSAEQIVTLLAGRIAQYYLASEDEQIMDTLYALGLGMIYFFCVEEDVNKVGDHLARTDEIRACNYIINEIGASNLDEMLVLLKVYHKSATEIVLEERENIEAVAERLMKKTSIRGKELEECLDKQERKKKR
jgi:ATP-dependent Zn protease